MYSLPTLSSLCPKMKMRKVKRLSIRSLACWGILPVEAANKNIKNIVQKMTFICKDGHEM
ncbi:hypothetical protein MTR_4g012660 [Medicago truncatula]|nr:hypothetical protein MTR_4g012660 [Medicago truncatula]